MKLKMTGAEAVVECIRREKVKHVFCVPGESYLGILDAIYDVQDIQLISNRHEGGASFMAEGYAKASGKPGVCMATRGVGASNLAIGIHTAMQDSTPLVAFIGQVRSQFMQREGFQEINLERFFSPIAKWAVQITDADRIPELVQRAFQVAKIGRPGPVVVGIPSDVIDSEVEMEFPSAGTCLPRPAPCSDEVQNALKLISKAERPLLIVGGGIKNSGAHDELYTLAEKLTLPVMASFRRHDAFPNNDPLYMGHIGLGTSKKILDTVKSADLIVAVGVRFSEVLTQGYTLFSSDQSIIHIDIDSGSIGKIYSPVIGMVADAKEALKAFLENADKFPLENKEKRLRWIAERRYIYEELLSSNQENNTKMDPRKVIDDLQALLPSNAIITNDAGNFSGWLHQFYQFSCPGTYIGPTSGAMGYGLPAAIGAKLAHPERVVVSLSGDGGFMMTMQEFETAVRYQIPIIALVFNNNMYGTIRMHQERRYPERISGTSLTNPNFAEMAQLFGGFGVRIDCHQDFAPALNRAIQSGKPALIEILTDPEQISVTNTISSLRTGKA